MDVDDLAAEFPADATPLRKLAAASYWLEQAQGLVDQYKAEAREAGLPKKFVKTATGKIPLELTTWQEMVMELSPEERAAATDALYGPMREKLRPLFTATRDNQ